MRGSEEVSNWMNMFRWIVKLIRDEYAIDEARLTRAATVEQDLALTLEQVERIIEYIQEAFGVRFPSGVMDEVVRLEELCLLASWLAGLYKRPDFLGTGYAETARAINSRAAA